MAVGQRSSFGELVYRYRRQLGLTQLQLAGRVQDESFRMGGEAGPLAGLTLSEKSVSNFERQFSAGSRIQRPRPVTVKGLAQVFGAGAGNGRLRCILRSCGINWQECSLRPRVPRHDVAMWP